MITGPNVIAMETRRTRAVSCRRRNQAAGATRTRGRNVAHTAGVSPSRKIHAARLRAMAARVISEYKAGGKASTDIYLGSLGQYANLFREDALEEVNWSGTFPWIARSMEEIVSRRGVLVYSSPRGASSSPSTAAGCVMAKKSG